MVLPFSSMSVSIPLPDIKTPNDVFLDRKLLTSVATTAKMNESSMTTYPLSPYNVKFRLTFFTTFYTNEIEIKSQPPLALTSIFA